MMLRVSSAQLAAPMQPEASPDASVRIICVPVTLTDIATATDQIVRWSAEETGRYVCLSNVHMVMEAFDDPTFREVVNSADLALPDGMPLVWAQRLLGKRGASRVPGPELTARVLRLAASQGIPVGFYGGSEDSLQRLLVAARSRWPGLRVAVSIAPPFRPVTDEEDAAYTRQIVDSGARILFVGIGCPKQERWMAKHLERIPCVMVGVGQAFDLLAGTKRDAPRWMQQAGLGWLFRLVKEPRRLWRRYAAHNPRFIALFAAQRIRLALERLSSHGRASRR
jgi:N-acetylglucosaminyldiphosphoundecaprenol N-acetyl-beta-D-mannosaminyltransferase